MTREYQRLIFTKHAWERAQDRRVSMEAIWQTVQNPEKQQSLGDDKTKYIRQSHGRPYHVVASWLPNERKWLVISVWVRGENDPVPVAWWLITAPFKLLWWLIRWLWRLIFLHR